MYVMSLPHLQPTLSSNVALSLIPSPDVICYTATEPYEAVSEISRRRREPV